MRIKQHIPEAAPAVATMTNVHVVGEGGVPIIGGDRGVSLRVTQGERVLITGPNGSGKSTVLRAMAGIVRPEVGTVELFGQDINELSDRRRSKLVAARVGVGFQAANLDDGFSVLDNLTMLHETTRHGRVPRDRLARIVTQLGLFGTDGSMLEQSAHTLSGGQKQRVSIGRLLLPRPELLLLDEPTAALDSGGTYGKRHTYEVLQEFVEADGATLVMVSHDAEAESIATRRVVVEDGAIVADEYLASAPPATHITEGAM
jgi:putative ABC transport system ATP-binding protein